ncbi:MAG: Fe-S cluster assembly ATPase SufC [Candidatus Levybacteria bacterium]|nr:Fe-S cluster assembly ATPase SufC [Candidatus Levybacteria bacterium]
MLIVKNLVAGIEGKEILHGVDLAIKPGEIHVVMGPNGSGKTSLVMSLMGHPGYKVKIQNSKFKIGANDMFTLLPEERARAGLFVSFQNPVEITGVSFLAFLRTASKSLRPDEKIPLSTFKEKVLDALGIVGLDESFMHRSVNEGFSGGERKRAEVAQMLLLRPKFAILDEIDSGLDVDSLKLVAGAIEHVAEEQKTGILLITHYQRILHFLKPNKVHMLIDGKTKKTGGMKLVRLIEKEGYAAV